MELFGAILTYSLQIECSFNHYLAKQSFELTEFSQRIFKMAARSFVDIGCELFYFSGLLNLKFCQQPFTNEQICSKVGIIRNEIFFFCFYRCVNFGELLTNLT